jgi:hypothetical protein
MTNVECRMTNGLRRRGTRNAFLHPKRRHRSHRNERLSAFRYRALHPLNPPIPKGVPSSATSDPVEERGTRFFIRGRRHRSHRNERLSAFRYRALHPLNPPIPKGVPPSATSDPVEERGTRFFIRGAGTGRIGTKGFQPSATGRTILTIHQSRKAFRLPLPPTP